MNLNPFSAKFSIPSSRLVLLGFLMLIGFTDAAFLAVEHYKGVVPPCSIVQGCQTVVTSSYATIGPVPIALLGAIYYVLMLAVAIGYWDTKKDGLPGILFSISMFGFLASLGLVYLQLFVLHAICLYCMGSAFISTLVFLLLAFTRSKNRLRAF